jgi:hypothetical protein
MFFFCVLFFLGTGVKGLGAWSRSPSTPSALSSSVKLLSGRAGQRCRRSPTGSPNDAEEAAATMAEEVEAAAAEEAAATLAEEVEAAATKEAAGTTAMAEEVEAAATSPEVVIDETARSSSEVAPAAVAAAAVV